MLDGGGLCQVLLQRLYSVCEAFFTGVIGLADAVFSLLTRLAIPLIIRPRLRPFFLPLFCCATFFRMGFGFGIFARSLVLLLALIA